MKLRLPSLKEICSFGLLMAGFSGTVQASHYQASDLTYICVAPNVYIVTAKIYRDCSGAALSTSETLKWHSLGCNTGRTVSMPLVPGTVQTGITLGLYCPTSVAQAQCNSSATLPNFETGTYRATVTFTASEQACQNWLFSMRMGNRPTIENVTNGQSAWLYSEAYVKLGSSINNNSPEFGVYGIAVPFIINVGMPMTYSNNVTEQDGDSIAYSLVAPLDDYNIPLSYSTITPGDTIYNKAPVAPFNTTTNRQYALRPLTPSTYSATFPMPSYDVNWNTPSQAVQAFPFFDLDPQSGSLSFVPSFYYKNTNPNAGRNKYAVAIQADEFRKINGVMTKVGHVRRDMLIIVTECGPNTNPNIPTLTANNTTITPATTINLRPGIPLNLQFNAQDFNSNDVITMQSNVAQVLPGATFTKTAASQPTGTVTWTPTAADIRSTPYYFTVSLRDNACPVAGMQIRTIGVRVTANGAVIGMTEDQLKGSGFISYPNPFGESASFRINVKTKSNQEILIYNALGQQVDRILLADLPVGEQTVVWENASRQAAGQYVAKLVGSDKTMQTVKFAKFQ